MTKLYFSGHVWIPQLPAMRKMVLSILVGLPVTELKTGFSSRRFSKISLKTQRTMNYTVKTRFRLSAGRPSFANIKNSKARAKGSRGKRNYQNWSTGLEVEVNVVHGVAGGHLGHVGSRGEGLRGLSIKFKPNRPKYGWDHGPRVHGVQGVHGVHLGSPQVPGLARGHAGELRYEVSLLGMAVRWRNNSCSCSKFFFSSSVLLHTYKVKYWKIMSFSTTTTKWFLGKADQPRFK